MLNKISVYLTISDFDFEPEEITAFLGIIPSKTHKKGEPIIPKGNPNYQYKHNHWSLKSLSNDSIELAKHIESIFEQVKEKWQILVDIGNQYYIEIECAIYIYDDSEQPIPIIHLDKEITQKLAELNAEIDIDLYVLPQDNKKAGRSPLKINQKD